MIRYFLLLIGLALLSTEVFGQIYPKNEDGQYEDMLSPSYYSTTNESFNIEVDKFVYYARQTPFQHPLQDSTGQMHSYETFRGFGDKIGPTNSGSHHAAIDYHINNRSSLVTLYAAHDGYISVSKEVARYRHFLSITTDIKDSIGNVLGKMVTLYAHIDLDLDADAGINLEGRFVKKGDIVSKNLYSGTKGGPHLHFEIRYYRNTDSGTEDFFGGNVGDKTQASAGTWTYGFWNPNAGYGFANPMNHFNKTETSTYETNSFESIKMYPNPANNKVTIDLGNTSGKTFLKITNLSGSKIYNEFVSDSKFISINTKDYLSDIYLIQVSNENYIQTLKLVKL